MNFIIDENLASPQAIAALRANPRFAEAMRASAAGIVAMHDGKGSHLLNWLMDDRGRLLFGYCALYLHFGRDPADPSSGLTPTRMQELCAAQDICSRGRAGAMLSLMRFAGYLAADASVADRRQRPLLATPKLIALIVQRLRLHFTAMAPLLADGDALSRALDDPACFRRMVIAMAGRFLAGFRFLTHAPGLGLFAERNAGMLILASLLIAGESGDGMPPRGAVPISISALARRFSVSRPHVLKLIRDAEAEGYLGRIGAGGDRVVLQPRLAEAAQNFFAIMFLFFADCARQALRNGAR